MDPNLMWNEGFGEQNQIEQAALEDFLPFRNSCMITIFFIVIYDFTKINTYLLQ